MGIFKAYFTLLKQSLIFIFPALFGLFSLRAQSTKDSILLALQKLETKKIPGSDTTKAILLSRLSNAVSEDEEIMDYAERSIPIAEQLISSGSPAEVKVGKRSMALALHNIGFVHQNKGEVEKGIEYMNKGLKLYRDINDKWGIAMVLGNLGYIYHNQGLLEKGLDHYLESLKLREEINDVEGAAFNLNNIGYLYFSMKQYDKTLDYYRRSLVIREKGKNKSDIAQSLHNIGYIYQLQAAGMQNSDSANRQFNLALKYYNLALRLRKEVNDKRGVAMSYNIFGSIFRDKARLSNDPDSIRSLHDRAFNYYKEALKLREETSDKMGIANSLLAVAGYYVKEKNYKEAERLALRSMTIAKETGYPASIESAAQSLSNIYNQQGKYKEAYEAHLLFKKMTDSLHNSGSQKALAKKAAQYELEKKLAQAEALQEKKDAIQEESRKKQVIIRNIFIGAFIVCMILSIFIFRGYLNKRKANETILYQKNNALLAQRTIEHQHNQLEAKQKEIEASYQYAKRIQTAQMASEKYIIGNLNKLKNKQS